MRRTIQMIMLAAASGIFAACQPSEPGKPTSNGTPQPAASATPSPTSTGTPSASSPSAQPMPDSSKVAALEGEWPGVEGTKLKGTKTGDKYKIEITDLDKTDTFEGHANGDVIEFTRKGKVETIKAATAEETGMKWLQGEKNCVVITKGSEGYCRN